MDGWSSEGCPCDLRGESGKALEHGTFELDFEGCVEFCWVEEWAWAKAEGRTACAVSTCVLWLVPGLVGQRRGGVDVKGQVESHWDEPWTSVMLKSQGFTRGVKGPGFRPLGDVGETFSGMERAQGQGSRCSCTPCLHRTLDMEARKDILEEVQPRQRPDSRTTPTLQDSSV